MNIFDTAYKIIFPDDYNFAAGSKTVNLLDKVNGKYFIKPYSHLNKSHLNK